MKKYLIEELADAKGEFYNKGYNDTLRSYKEDPIHEKSGEYFKDLLPLEELKGATILNIGLHHNVDEGGFTIDYTKPEFKKPKRLILGYTELGSWIEWCGEILKDIY